MELLEVSQLSSYQPSKPFLLFGHGSKPQFQSIPGYIGPGIPETKDFFDNFGYPGQTSSDGSDPKELLPIDHPCHLINRNAPKYIFTTKR